MALKVSLLDSRKALYERKSGIEADLQLFACRNRVEHHIDGLESILRGIVRQNKFFYRRDTSDSKETIDQCKDHIPVIVLVVRPMVTVFTRLLRGQVFDPLRFVNKPLA